ncbi:hypothetical protein N7G274_009653 [Stereocaulon virgatum]|uniref:Uncharacterized protein n=1 Tax=Stereocaulon virgatum TaxID=373712 RepID=A0ABR3ZX53_9LECA
MAGRFLQEADVNYSTTDLKVLSHQFHHPSNPCPCPPVLDVLHYQPAYSSVSTSFNSVPKVRNSETPFETHFRRPLYHNDPIGDRETYNYPDNEPDTLFGRYRLDDSRDLADVDELKNDMHDMYHRPKPHRTRSIEATRGSCLSNDNREQRHHRNTHEPRPRVKPYGPRPMGSLPHGVNPCLATSHNVVQTQLGLPSARSYGAYPHQHNTSFPNCPISDDRFEGRFGDDEQFENDFDSSQKHDLEQTHTEWALREKRPHPVRDITFTDSNHQGPIDGEPRSRIESMRSGLKAASMPRASCQTYEDMSRPNQHFRDALRDYKQ